MDQAEFTWDATPYSDTRPAPATGRRDASAGHMVTVLRAVAFLVVATLAILVLLPAAIAAQAAFVV